MKYINEEEEYRANFQKKRTSIRTINGYTCPGNKTLELNEIKVHKTVKKNREEKISEDRKEKEHIYICKTCEKPDKIGRFLFRILLRTARVTFVTSRSSISLSSSMKISISESFNTFGMIYPLL
ncbi:hypothetical protein AGMMS49960_21530 [Betaproteobacteria bacterium]|nr:hypothetical protein AGMMS49960_21530 [Betaproteobacteria bacterium]